MRRMHTVRGIEYMPIYVVSESDPFERPEEDVIADVPLVDLLPRLREEEGIYLVDSTSVPGTTRMARLV